MLSQTSALDSRQLGGKAIAHPLLGEDIPWTCQGVFAWPAADLLPDGAVKLELGDECIELTPREIRMILQALGGFGMQYERLQKGRDWARLAADLGSGLKATQRQLREVQAELEELRRRGAQLPLDLATTS